MKFIEEHVVAIYGRWIMEMGEGDITISLNRNMKFQE